MTFTFATIAGMSSTKELEISEKHGHLLMAVTMGKFFEYDEASSD